LFEPLVEGRRAHLELAQDRLHAELATTRLDERYDRLLVGSISWAKEAPAAFRISFARRSSLTSLRSRRSYSFSALFGRSSRSPSSASAWRTQLRSAS
jgi:hypothetical protein